ncbi:NAD(P)H-dependent oxidoreductase subunit E [Marivibrio halodurans]|uniref:NAD(P)H-dependent oxidoreductase subunit E n=1 Tax=Marivibrio halodurans TaxID=2039722 RepID=A0A8J7RZM3_9PROT|nr:NAD(P)H-dependent oxidoreductase subunit E [Marivibrio halodurans]MBP5857525.1 NAD(P)H-dependent oxidoreductase subunit E [Marivibrio halodurans]
MNAHQESESDEVEALVVDMCRQHDNAPAALLEILHDIQDAVGHVPQSSLAAIADALNLSRAEVHGVVSFYHDFRAAPAGTVTVKVCRAEACQSMGALTLIEDLCRRHGVTLGETSADKGLTIEPIYCLGNCALSPAALVNGKPVGRADVERVDGAIREARS